MQPRRHHLRNGRVLVISEAAVEDAGAVLDYVEGISGESDFLTFGPGEFELTAAEEENVLRKTVPHNALADFFALDNRSRCMLFFHYRILEKDNRT